MKEVLYSGMFDLLHLGHVEALEKAKKYGDYLVVHVASDQETTAVKGKSRPVIPGRERARMVLALACVDEVLYDDKYLSFTELLDKVCPDVVVRNEGGDLEGDEEGECAKRSITIVRLPRAVAPSGLDTSSIIEKIGGQDSPKPTVVNYVLKGPDGRFLIQERDNIPNILNPGAFCFPGGGIDDGEDALHAVERELHEETGIRLPLSAFSYLTELVYPEGAPARVFYCETDSPDYQSLEGKMHWMDKEEIREKLLHTQIVILEKL